MTQDDHDAFADIGQTMAATNGYTPQQASDLYITDGTIDDWLWGAHQIFSYTFEMYPVELRLGGLLPAGRGDPGRRPPATARRSSTCSSTPTARTGSSASRRSTAAAPPPTTVYSDTFETATGWTTNPGGTDTATTGQWERGDPEATTSSGAKQLGTTVSGANDLVTGRLAGASAGDYDIDGGMTSHPLAADHAAGQRHADAVPVVVPRARQQLLQRRLLPRQGRRHHDHHGVPAARCGQQPQRGLGTATAEHLRLRRADRPHPDRGRRRVHGQPRRGGRGRREDHQPVTGRSPAGGSGRPAYGLRSTRRP